MMAQDEENGYTAFSNPSDFFYHILSYLETPPYLRRVLFPYHPNLRTAGALPSLDTPHHLRAEEWCKYREGVTLQSHGGSHEQKKHKKNDRSEELAETLVNAGFGAPVRVAASIPPNTRVTLEFDSDEFTDNPTAAAVSPDTPRENAGYYWGYAPRLASSLSSVFTECPFGGGYDYSIGTSERGISLKSLTSRLHTPAESSEDDEEHPAMPMWEHLLIVFGGVAGLEVALQNDKELSGKVSQASELFDAWVNLVQGQGSRTIRTEEAVWLGLMGLKELVDANAAAS
jgi:predicted SPOUT superfamily RNA methylase MTH1